MNDSKCEKEHPKRCFKYCRCGDKHRHGCKEESSCEYFNPSLCKFSVQKRICNNKDCTFVHLKGTRRKESNPDQTRKNSRENDHTLANKKSRTIQVAKYGRGISAEQCSSIPDHFLELKGLVQSMQANFFQEISAIKASLLCPRLLSRSDRSGRLGGGALLYSHINLPISESLTFDDKICEAVLCKFETVKKCIAIVYRPPEASVSSFSNILSFLTESFKKVNDAMIVTNSVFLVTLTLYLLIGKLVLLILVRDSVRTIVRTNCPDNSLICIVQLSGQKCWTIGQFREKNTIKN